ncbi:MAG: fibronectin type III domain-containing protein [Candidatus Dojkabacteria bacterium]|nr:fibronectin type III domain-containing protein [Candidatus Dojkabacteria bacterium]
MYITPYQKRQLTVILILVIGIPLTIFGIYSAVKWFTSAGTNTQPHDVVLTNLTTSSITVTWTTEEKQTGSVVPVLNGSDGSTVIDERGSSRMYTHYVELDDLEPGTTYDFKIVSGSDTYTDTDGNEFSFTTANISTDTPVPQPIHGELENSSDDDIVIYVFPKDKSTYPVSTVPSSSGNWLIDLSALRKVSDKSLYDISDSTELILIATSGVDNAGIVTGTYSDIFDSSGKLTETLVTEGSAYYTSFSDESKLIAQEEVDDSSDNTTDNSSSDTSTDDTTTNDDFERDYELKSDLAWVNLVSSGDSISVSPTKYGEETVMITNLTDVSFTVLWYSETKEFGYIMYGTDPDNLNDKGRDERDGISSQGEYYLHSVEVTQLEPETDYYFQVYSGEDTYDTIYDLTTFATMSSPPEFETIAGSVNVSDYESFVVIATFADEDEIGSSGTSYPLSTLVDSEGSWILTIGSARDEEGQYFEKDSSDKVNFESLYLGNTTETDTTIGEATTNEVELTVEDSFTGFVRIPLLSDYGILMD